MVKSQIHRLLFEGIFPEKTTNPSLIETHISWVVLCDRFVYKIKKPVRYSFLDFSTIEKRKFYCEREVFLNKRMTIDIYLDVLPVTEDDQRIVIGNTNGTLIDYCVKMVRIDASKQLDKLLVDKAVKDEDIIHLAEKIAGLHRHADIIYNTDVSRIKHDFNDIMEEKDAINRYLGEQYSDIISDAVKKSNHFIAEEEGNLRLRQQNGFFRDVHGDLHCKNIFMLSEPQPFDCLEFNDDYRRIDVLNETAFLCMDLESFGRKDLADLFINHYNKLFPSMNTESDSRIFTYYKSYRANVRAKVNCLRAVSSVSVDDKKSFMQQSSRYLLMLRNYMDTL